MDSSSEKHEDGENSDRDDESNESEFTEGPPKKTFQHSDLYKMGYNKELTQQQRRELLLKEQKERRHHAVDSNRDLSSLEDDESDEENMEVDIQKKKKKALEWHLMQSEWFKEVPGDLEDDWLVKITPEGQRVLVIARKQNTIVISKQNKPFLVLKTHLPGGGWATGSMKERLTVLDCILNKTTRTIYVLDCLYWNMLTLDCDAMFRFHWLRNKFHENAQLREASSSYQFQLIDFIPAKRNLIQEQLFMGQRPEQQPNGVCFYHKESSYVFEETPLFGWLYCYMLPEKLGIIVPQEVTDRMPEGYKCLEQFVEDLKVSKKKFKHFRNRHKIMDTS